MSDWEIRTGSERDIDAVLALWRAAQGTPSATDTEDGVARLLDHDPGSLLLAEAERAMVGSLIAAWDGWRGSFYRLTVHPEHRRRGLATALVRAGEERLRELGAVRLTAIVAGEDGNAAALWSSVGYERQAARDRYVRMLD